MKAIIKAKGLNLRKEPKVELGNIITVLKSKNILEVITPDNNGWTKVAYGIYSGYVSSRFIEVVKDTEPMQITLALRALNIAISQLGNSEIPKGSNWGHHIQKYLNSVGIESPSPWCMGFVYWCFDEAAKEMGVENPLIKTGHVLTQWRKTPKKYKVVGKPQKGDIGIMDFGGGKGHTFIVSGVSGDKVNTIEGNSNDEGSREGYEVCRKPGGRLISSCIGFIRI